MSLKEITEEEYSETKKKFSKLVIIVNHPNKEECLGCQQYEPILKKIAEDFNDVEFRTISFKNEGLIELKKDYGEKMTKVPATMVFYDGCLVDKAVGALSYESLRRVLKIYFNI